eukprot:m.203648 g.203648  ORF g.203648 m.203648 type:complete len:74 (-) comp15373_c0_seq7:3290-3511(-)
MLSPQSSPHRDWAGLVTLQAEHSLGPLTITTRSSTLGDTTDQMTGKQTTATHPFLMPSNHLGGRQACGMAVEP